MFHHPSPLHPFGPSRASHRLVLLVTLGLVAVGAAPETAPADQPVQAPVAASTGTASAGLVAITERPAIAVPRSAPPRASRSRYRAVRPAVSHRRTVPRRAALRSTADDTCSGPGWRERRGRAALASLRADAVSAPRARFEFAAGRTGYLGLTYLHERRIVLYIRGCRAESAALLRHVAAHELGHAFDGAYMSSAERADWMRARGIASGTPWFGCHGCNDFATPAGDFAEVYAQWARGGGDNRSRMAGRPGPAELSALARTFFHA